MMKFLWKNSRQKTNSIAKLKVSKRRKRIIKVKKKVPEKRKSGKKINKDNLKVRTKLQGDLNSINICFLLHKVIHIP
jgi:hypothetical protein